MTTKNKFMLTLLGVCIASAAWSCNCGKHVKQVALVDAKTPVTASAPQNDADAAAKSASAKK